MAVLSIVLLGLAILIAMFLVPFALLAAISAFRRP
jgi:hypothetical protein